MNPVVARPFGSQLGSALGLLIQTWTLQEGQFQSRRVKEIQSDQPIISGSHNNVENLGKVTLFHWVALNHCYLVLLVLSEQPWQLRRFILLKNLIPHSSLTLFFFVGEFNLCTCHVCWVYN